MTWGERRLDQAHITATTVFVALRGRHWSWTYCRSLIPPTKDEGSLSALALDSSSLPLAAYAATTNPISNSCSWRNLPPPY